VISIITAAYVLLHHPYSSLQKNTISDSNVINLEEDGRVIVINTNSDRISQVCPSYGLQIHIHNDTLASLLCKKLKLGNIGIATDLPAEPNKDMLEWIRITDQVPHEVQYGGVVTDNCRGFNRSLGITCAGNIDILFSEINY
jgi:hypothetical protein